ncbi:MAG TPA: CBS domain-containing protein [Nitrososphaera sp.]|nr:CBS domain-containing protein [Nitrososphaera sp.]
MYDTERKQSNSRCRHVSNKLVTIDSDTTAFEIANRILQKRISAVIVMDSAKPVGILPERDLTRQVCAKDTPPSKIPATVIMSQPLLCLWTRIIQSKEQLRLWQEMA